VIQVIDASVGVKWFIDESGSGVARTIFTDVFRQPSRYVVPELFFYEVYAVCMRRHPDPAVFAKQGISILERMPFLRIPLTNSTARAGANLVSKGFTGYDAVYASLAKSMKGQWLTFDVAAYKKA